MPSCGMITKVFMFLVGCGAMLKTTAFSFISKNSHFSKISGLRYELKKIDRCLSMSASASDMNLYRRTPLVLSQPLSDLCNQPVYLKLDLLQPSGSFKDRGMANLCHTLYYDPNRNIRQLVSSSGGNAGLAVATVARQLEGMKVQVVVPKTTKAIVIEKLKSLGAEVTVHGENWNQADLLAREMVETSEENSAYVSPYDDVLLWDGHSTVVDEIFEQIPEDQAVSAVIASVGGGGLICGILDGLKKHDKAKNILVIAAETEGASSFDKGWQAGRAVSLESIDSVATSLGALQVTEEAIRKGKEHINTGGKLQTGVCTDEEAIQACVNFAKDHKMLVEPACGAALAAIYSDRLRNTLFGNDPDDTGVIIVEVCGGNAVNLELMNIWQSQFLE